MSVIAKLRYLRIAPRKVRLVADLVRGKSADEAQTILGFAIKRGSEPLLKLVRQAIANAKNNFQLDPVNLYISKITVDEGPKFKRWMPRARGQAYEIQKKTSHITIVLDEIKKGKKKIKKVQSKKEKEKTEEAEEIFKTEKPAKDSGKPGQAKFRPEKPAVLTREKPKPKIEKGIRQMFRRKAF